MLPRPADPRVLGEAHQRILRAAARVQESYGDVHLRLEGGTALAAYYLGHRESQDLDLFGDRGLHAAEFGAALVGVLESAGVDVEVAAGGEGFAELAAAGVRVHIARALPFRLEAPLPTDEGLPVASFRDLAAGKLHAVCDRFEPRDFIDLHAIVTRPDELGAAPAVDLQRARVGDLVLDVQAVDPGLNPSAVGQALARGLDRQVIGGFPLRLLAKIEEREVQGTLRIAVDVCARLTRERME